MRYVVPCVDQNAGPARRIMDNEMLVGTEYSAPAFIFWRVRVVPHHGRRPRHQINALLNAGDSAGVVTPGRLQDLSNKAAIR